MSNSLFLVLLMPLMASTQDVPSHNVDSVLDHLYFGEDTSFVNGMIQLPIGASCITSEGKPGVCGTIANCPSLQRLSSILLGPYDPIIIKNSCRDDQGITYVCCQTSSSSSSLNQGNLKETHSACSRPPPNIKNGQPIDNWNYPWLAAVGYARGNEDFILVCTGTLLSNRHVLTARHCFHKKTSNSTHVRLGDYDLSSNIDGRQHVDYAIEGTFTPYVNFTRDNYENDLIVLYLDRDVSFTSTIQPACLVHAVEEDTFYFRKNVIAVTYGNYNIDLEIIQRVPHQEQLSVIENKNCQILGNILDSPLTIDDKVLCVGELNLNSCKGESGGPVHYYDKSTGRMTVIGIVGISQQCDKGKFEYNIVTKLSPYLEFFRNTLT